MSEFVDPFDAPPADEAQASYEPPAEAFEPPPADPAPEPPKKAPAKKAAPKVGSTVVTPVVNVGADTGLSVTFKGGAGFDSPWLVPKYNSVGDALTDLGVPEEQVEAMTPGQRWDALFKRVQLMAKSFVGSAPVSTTAGAPAQQRQPAPQAAQEAPNGEERFCAHGKMRFKSDVSKAGKPYKGFFCTSPDRNAQCQAQFLR